MADAVVVRDLTKTFGDFTAVDAVSFTVREGEIFGFLGPNGAGKTTTIKMLIGLLHPTHGTARVAGIDATSHSDALKQRVGYMSQMFSLYADLTVAENITLFGGLYGVTGDRLAARMTWVLEMSDLVGREKQLTGSLPLGWKQRLALGCAILHEPPILFLDEPTSGVDPIARRHFWELIDSLAADGTTVFVSTHYMEEAEFCNRLGLMNRGALVALDSPRNLRGSMPEPLFEVVTEDPPGVATVLQHVDGVLEAAMFGRDVHAVVRDDAVKPEELAAALTAKAIPFESIRPITPSLEDVFVSHIRRVGGAVVG